MGRCGRRWCKSGRGGTSAPGLDDIRMVYKCTMGQAVGSMKSCGRPGLASPRSSRLYMPSCRGTVSATWTLENSSQITICMRSCASIRGWTCRREDKDGANGTPTAQAPEKGVAPATVEPVLRYLRDLECLTKLTSTQEPPCQLYCAQRQLASFVVEDASGKGKGDVVIEQYGVDYKLGAWNLE